MHLSGLRSIKLFFITIAMNFKLSTKEKFAQIELEETSLSANMTAELDNLLSECVKMPEKNIVLSLKPVIEVAPEAALVLLDWQSRFYELKQSFVLCELSGQLENRWEEDGILEQLNTTPTLSEAWDIVQMEEIERELFSDYDEEG